MSVSYSHFEWINAVRNEPRKWDWKIHRWDISHVPKRRTCINEMTLKCLMNIISEDTKTIKMTRISIEYCNLLKSGTTVTMSNMLSLRAMMKHESTSSQVVFSRWHWLSCDASYCIPREYVQYFCVKNSIHWILFFFVHNIVLSKKIRSNSMYNIFIYLMFVRCVSYTENVRG